LGIFPVMHNRKLILLHISHAHASSSFSDEDGDDGGDPSDPDDPDDPNDPTPPDCSGGYTSDPVTQTSLDGNITTTTNCYEVYDGCGNDLGQSCDVPTQCGIESASIYLSASTGNLGDDVILNATVTTVGGATPLFEFQQSSDGGTSWDDVGNDPNVASFTYTIDESGQNKFRVIVSCSCSIAVTSSPATFLTNFTGPQCSGTNTASISWTENYSVTASGGSSTTTLQPFTVTYSACGDVTSNVWRLNIQSITGTINIIVDTGGSRNPNTYPPINQTEANDAVTVMKAYYMNGRGSWHTEAASRAHEEYHLAQIECVVEIYYAAEANCINNITVPLNNYSNSASALAALLSLWGDQSLNGLNTDAYSYVLTLGDSPGDSPYAVGQIALNPSIIGVQNLATSKSWTVPAGTTTPSYTAACPQSTTRTTCP